MPGVESVVDGSSVADDRPWELVAQSRSFSSAILLAKAEHAHPPVRAPPEFVSSQLQLYIEPRSRARDLLLLSDAALIIRGH
jgi:hypothetical protein